MRRTLGNSRVLKYQQIAFVAHSMGGIVVREFLQRFLDTADPKRLFPQVRFLYFLGTPISGVNIDTVVANIAASLRNLEPLPQIIRASHTYVSEQARDWEESSVLRDLPLYCAYEEEPTDVSTWPIRRWLPDGFKEMIGVKRIIVEEESATRGCHKTMPLETNHFGLAKPVSRAAPAYTFLLEALEDTKPDEAQGDRLQ